MIPTFKSRFGYHPCDYPTFLKLKRIHKGYHEALRKAAAHRRWIRKRPHNRHGPEPVVAAVYRELLQHPEIVERFHAARRPQAEPELVQKLGISHELIEGWHLALLEL